MARVILHNAVSLDGAYTGFGLDLGMYYTLVSKARADVHLIGSRTAKSGLEMYGKVPKETKRDFKRPVGKEKKPYWAIVDSKGSLKGLLHAYRRFEHCRDVIIFISKSTPEAYVQYLEERGYDYIVAGTDRVNLGAALAQLAKWHKAKTVLVDSGPSLGRALLSRGLVDEIHLVVVPELAGTEPLWRKAPATKLELIGIGQAGKGCALLRYRIPKSS